MGFMVRHVLVERGIILQTSRPAIRETDMIGTWIKGVGWGIIIAFAWSLTASCADNSPTNFVPLFEIQCLDAESGRGLPLVELETVNHLRFVSDNAGRVAFGEADLMKTEVFFHVKSHGYTVGKDGFGFRGVRLVPMPGAKAAISLNRSNVAERLYRITGEGRYRDSLLLGYPMPLPGDSNPGRVAGQDSIQAASYHGRIHWFWGDTDLMAYPLGHFRTAGAVTLGTGPDLLRPHDGLSLNYFTNSQGFSRPMFPYPERSEGVIWIDGLVVVPDASGVDRLVCHYSRRKGLEAQLEHGLAVYRDEKDVFEPVKVLAEGETWRFPQGHTTCVEEQGKWIYCGIPLLHVRVPARYEALLQPESYEAFTCLPPGGHPDKSSPLAGPDGPIWSWRKDAPPVGPAQEARWMKLGVLDPKHSRFSPVDPATSRRPLLHAGTVRWNSWRKRWVVIATELGGSSSHLGEVWFTEGHTPVGPFTHAVKIVTHDRQSFYNPCHHDFLDEEHGRRIYFEGTYVNTFSGNPDATPRYNYNQIMYRLDLADPRLAAARAD